MVNFVNIPKELKSPGNVALYAGMVLPTLTMK